MFTKSFDPAFIRWNPHLYSSWTKNLEKKIKRNIFPNITAATNRTQISVKVKRKGVPLGASWHGAMIG